MAAWKKVVRNLLGGLLAIIVVVLVVGYIVSRVKLARTYDITPVALQLPTDSASLYRGRTLAESYGCTGCHTSTLSGEVMFSAFPLIRVAPSNLTRGQGGAGATYTNADWERAIRHGIGKDGRKLVVMPAEVFATMMDRDVAQLIAYLKTLPPVNNVLPRTTLWPIAHVLHAANVNIVAAELIDHSARPRDIPAGVTAEYGRYLGTPCRTCHGATLVGGQPPDPDSPPAPNLRAGTAASTWTEAQFITTIRTGTTPDGRHLRPQYMPWKAFARMSDDELRALWLYIKSQQH